jgi:two-component system sensor histidine kinase ChiS
MTICGINNVLYALWIINTGNAMQYSMVILCFTSTMVVSRRFSRALYSVEKLSNEVEEKNISLQKMDRIKDQFLASTSHELRTPLNGMIGLSESMIEGAAGNLPRAAIENLTLISSNGHRLAGMVNDLLDMAKIQGEGINLNLRPVDIFSVTDSVLKLTLPLASGKQLKIFNSVEPCLPSALADEDRIRQVMYNLLGNAVKFTNSGVIEISARVIQRSDDKDESEQMIEVSVSDTGIGIPDEYREMIFEPYRQVDGSDTRSYSGTGLGLAIAKNIIELHNGTITMAPGKNVGSVFTFTLPVSDEQTDDAVSEVVIESLDDDLQVNDVSCADGQAAGRPVILVVDDDPVNIRVVQNYFMPVNYSVKSATDGIRALEIIEREGPVDLVLLDIMMPVLSGFEVCRRIRVKYLPEELPVIMLTAKNMMSDINEAFESGANDYIVKPFNSRVLLARTGTMLRLRNIRRSAAEGFTVRDRNSAYSLKFSEIIYITAHAKKIVIHMVKGEIELPVLIKNVIDRLPPDLFIRIHKSHIINVNYLHSLIHIVSGRYRVRLSNEDDTELPVGSAFLEALRKKI